MQESDDSSFCWTGASTSEDSDMVADERENREDECVSDSSYKKKLQKKLSKERKQSDAQVKQELLHELSVKREPGSEDDAPAPGRPERGTHHHSDDASSKTNEKKYKSELINSVHLNGEQQESDSTEYKPKKKKMKRNKNSPEKSNYSTDVEESIVEESQFHTKRRQSLYENGNSDIEPKKIKKKRKTKDASISSENISEEILLTSKKHKTLPVSEDSNAVSNVSTKRSIELSIADNGHIEEVADKKKTRKKSRRSSKISDLIQFEEETDSRFKSNETANTKTDSYSSHHKQYLNSNPHLHPLCYESDDDPRICEDDDIFLLHCPQEINIMSLKDMDITLDNKSKLKVDNVTFVGNLESENSRISILAYYNKKVTIKNECVERRRFHRRIPRPHFSEDSIMLNNQTDFIPLPETKCRHPLFGLEYKKAMKIPSSVKAHLKRKEKQNVSDMIVPSLSSGHKKKKKHKREAEMVEPERKRKQAPPADGGPPAPKKRRVKQEPTDTWDSAKAIEESLFNY